jgi:hypothetical protein
MLRSLRSKITYANVAATIALFLALSGGVAYAANTVFSTDIVDGEVKTADLGNRAVTGDKVTDFSLSNQDVGVLFAEVRGDAVVASSSGAVTVQRVNAPVAGNYSVRFGRAVDDCTAVATIGSAGTTRASGQVNVADRVGDAKAVLVDTNDDAGKAADRPFRLVVVC